MNKVIAVHRRVLSCGRIDFVRLPMVPVDIRHDRRDNLLSILAEKVPVKRLGLISGILCHQSLGYINLLRFIIWLLFRLFRFRRFLSRGLRNSECLCQVSRGNGQRRCPGIIGRVFSYFQGICNAIMIESTIHDRNPRWCPGNGRPGRSSHGQRQFRALNTKARGFLAQRERSRCRILLRGDRIITTARNQHRQD